MTKKKFPKAVLPYIDQDYIDKLSDVDKAWLRAFNLVYYLGDSNSSKQGEERKRLANRDLMTPTHKKAKAAKIKAPRRYYTEDDYKASDIVSFADSLIEVIDSQTESKIIPILRGKNDRNTS